MLKQAENHQVRELLHRGFYSMAFQPIRETHTARPFGFEALLRGPADTPLAHPQRLFHERAYLDPDLLLNLDMACLGAALRAGRVLNTSTKLFINIHGTTLLDLVANQNDLLALLREVHLDPSRLVLEISESTESASLVQIASSLNDLKKLGIQFALDDVGSSFPWLDHLLWLAPDYLKLDHALARDLHTSARKQRLLTALCEMAESLGARCIVEGVESPEDWHTVCDLGIPYAQGFWLGYPCPASDWTKGDGSAIGQTGVAVVYEPRRTEDNGGELR